MQCICLDMAQVKIRCLITNLKQTLVKSQSDKITKQIINQRGLIKLSNNNLEARGDYVETRIFEHDS